MKCPTRISFSCLTIPPQFPPFLLLRLEFFSWWWVVFAWSSHSVVSTWWFSILERFAFNSTKWPSRKPTTTETNRSLIWTSFGWFFWDWKQDCFKCYEMCFYIVQWKSSFHAISYHSQAKCRYKKAVYRYSSPKGSIWNWLIQPLCRFISQQESMMFQHQQKYRPRCITSLARMFQSATSSIAFRIPTRSLLRLKRSIGGWLVLGKKLGAFTIRVGGLIASLTWPSPKHVDGDPANQWYFNVFLKAYVPWSIHSIFFLRWWVTSDDHQPPPHILSWVSISILWYPLVIFCFWTRFLTISTVFFLDNTGKVGTENGISFRRGYRVLIFGHVFSWVVKSCRSFQGNRLHQFHFYHFYEILLIRSGESKISFGCKTWRNCRLCCGEPGAALHLVHLLSHRRNRFPGCFFGGVNFCEWPTGWLFSNLRIKHYYTGLKGKDTLQGTNISHLGKSKNIFKSALVGDMLIPWRIHIW